MSSVAAASSRSKRCFSAPEACRARHRKSRHRSRPREPAARPWQGGGRGCRGGQPAFRRWSDRRRSFLWRRTKQGSVCQKRHLSTKAAHATWRALSPLIMLRQFPRARKRGGREVPARKSLCRQISYIAPRFSPEFPVSWHPSLLVRGNVHALRSSLARPVFAEAGHPTCTCGGGHRRRCPNAQQPHQGSRCGVDDGGRAGCDHRRDCVHRYPASA